MRLPWQFEPEHGGQLRANFSNHSRLCDSIVTLELAVHPLPSTELVVELCEGATYKGVVFQADTLLLETLASQWTGCDSSIHTQIKVWPKPKAVWQLANVGERRLRAFGFQ